MSDTPVSATFRFHEELNDFLPPAWRERDHTRPCARAATVKHMIEALGVPHTEVGLILVNGVAAGFEHRLRDGDRVAVYPMSVPRGCPEGADLPLVRVRQAIHGAPRRARFVADAHLGGLARLLRLAGFDTLYDNRIHDDDVVAIARDQGRIVLSRDVELLKRRDVAHGCYVHALKPQAQLREIVARLELAGDARPFSLCLSCNVPLRPVAKARVRDRLPERVRAGHDRFTTCPACGRVFWEGSHWRRMTALLAEVLGQCPGPDLDPGRFSAGIHLEQISAPGYKQTDRREIRDRLLGRGNWRDGGSNR